MDFNQGAGPQPVLFFFFGNHCAVYWLSKWEVNRVAKIPLGIRPLRTRLFDFYGIAITAFGLVLI